jgi:hypothetical protein
MNNEFPRMVYKAGGPYEIQGSQFEYLIIQDAGELGAALASGWSMTTDEARALATVPSPSGAPTRAELEQKATKLGIEFSPRIGDAKLNERIEAALAAKA